MDKVHIHIHGTANSSVQFKLVLGIIPHSLSAHLRVRCKEGDPVMEVKNSWRLSPQGTV